MDEDKIYTILTDSNFQREVLESPVPVLVEFGASWCGTCHMIAPIIKELASKFQGKMKVCKMDVDANEQIIKKYGVRDLPTLLYFKNGQFMDYIIGIAPKTEIVNKFQNLLKIESRDN